MKQLLLFVCSLFAANFLALGHPYEPAIAFLPDAKDVYLTTVTSVDGNHITFSVKEVLRGKAVSKLILKPYTNENYAVTSYWILASCSAGFSKDSVGLPMKGFCGFIPIAIDSEDGEQGITLDHVKRLLQ